MSITVADNITNFNSNIGDSSTDRISAAERLQYITEATVWLQQELGNDHQNSTYSLEYFDTVNEYKVTAEIADLMEGSDVRRARGKRTEAFTYKDPRELLIEIDQGYTEPSYAIDRYDKDWYLIVNFDPKHKAGYISSCDSFTADGGTWVVDAATSDATNLTIDTVEYTAGNGSFNFDIDVSQSGNNKASILNSTMTSKDLSQYEDLASFIFDVYIPDATYTSSVTLFWGSDTSNYWSATATTDINGNAIIAGWNRIQIAWSAATATGTPDETAIDYMRFDINFGASQGDDTDYRIDNIKIVIPETVVFLYTSWYVGTATDGTTEKTAFTATTDIPFYSGQYDNYRFAVGHKAAALAFKNLRLPQEATVEDQEAYRSLQTIRDRIPSSTPKQTKMFKPVGINFRAKRGRR